MSFLAQLRKSKNEEKQGLRLCYLIHIDAQHRAWLSLALAELKNGLPSPDWKAYSLQAQHLEQMPPFLEDSDRLLLKQLSTKDRLWINEQSRPLLGDALGSTTIKQIIESKRCYICTAKPAPGPLKARALTIAEKPLSLTLDWLVDEEGKQRLTWALPKYNRLCMLGEDLIRDAFALNTQKHTLEKIAYANTTDDLSDHAIKLANDAPILSRTHIEAFIENNKSQWEKANLPLPKELEREDHTAKTEAVLSCSTHTQANIQTVDTLKLAYRYQTDTICFVCDNNNVFKSYEFWDGETLHTCKRDLTWEASILNDAQTLIEKAIPEMQYISSTQCWQSDSIKAWINLFIKQSNKLAKNNIKLICEPGFRYHFVEAQACHAGIDNKDNFVQLTLDLEIDGKRVSLQEILKQIQEFNTDLNEEFSFVHLDDGRLLLVPIEKLLNLSDEFGDLVFAGRETLKLEENQLSRLKKLEEYLPENTQWQGDTELLEKAINIHKSPAVLDSELSCVNAELRPYQWLGLCWLQHLNSCGVNGLLADDMGLGKTLQTISFISFLHAQSELKSPALIVLPTSLLHNWSREIDQFAPQLSYLIMHGTQRHQHWIEIEKYDVILTSYQLIANDLEKWQNLNLSWIILDEAQNIKNPQTQISQAVKCLPASRRLCLSGTPVENHLGELWSIFDFLMPGCLGDKQSFKQQFRNPIEKDSNANRLEQLLERIAPFMLRRNKDQVAKDLPPKTITPQYIQLSEEQLKFYEDIKTNTWLEVQEQLEGTDNSGQQQILLLSAILKLRQACCDPALLEETDTPSAKREHCIEMITELVEEKRSILVFSQFTTMLDILAKDLEKQDINYLMLTGKSRNRQDLVDKFQSGEAQVMLMSLKAGGVGLNLTAADTVIHYDPWWNDAAERQATDRAHRIGQDKPVFVYKLIAENTIEEKIAKLQEQKALLGQHISHQAQSSGEKFALALEDLLALLNDNNE